MEFARASKANQEMLEQAQQKAKTEAIAAVRRLSTTQTSLSSSQRSIICLGRDITGLVTSHSEMNRWLQQELSTTRRKVRLQNVLCGVFFPFLRLPELFLISRYLTNN